MVQNGRSNDTGDAYLTLSLTVHRGTQQIGGTCMKSSTRWRPPCPRCRATVWTHRKRHWLLPVSLDRIRPATVLICHPHQDHWGLVEELPRLADLDGIEFGQVDRDYRRREASSPYPEISRPGTAARGPSPSGRSPSRPTSPTILPLTPICCWSRGAGKRILYTGDFRRHGRNRCW